MARVYCSDAYDEYKRQVLELLRPGDRSVHQICQELDLTESSVRRWVNSDTTSNGIMTQNSLTETDQQEQERLRYESKQLKTKREILKRRPSSSRNLYEIPACVRA